MPCCPVCDRPIPMKAERDGLLAMSDPWTVYYKGIRLLMPPIPAKMIYTLLSQPRPVSKAVLEMHLKDATDPKTLDIHASRTNKIFRAHGLKFRLTSKSGFMSIVQD